MWHLHTARLASDTHLRHVSNIFWSLLGLQKDTIGLFRLHDEQRASTSLPPCVRLMQMCAAWRRQQVACRTKLLFWFLESMLSNTHFNTLNRIDNLMAIGLNRGTEWESYYSVVNNCTLSIKLLCTTKSQQHCTVKLLIHNSSEWQKAQWILLRVIGNLSYTQV